MPTIPSQDPFAYRSEDQEMKEVVPAERCLWQSSVDEQ